MDLTLDSISQADLFWNWFQRTKDLYLSFDAHPRPFRNPGFTAEGWLWQVSSSPTQRMMTTSDGHETEKFSGTDDNDYGTSQTNMKRECGICREDESIPQARIELPCGHEFDVLCLREWFAMSTNQDCPMCRRSLKHTCGHVLDLGGLTHRGLTSTAVLGSHLEGPCYEDCPGAFDPKSIAQWVSTYPTDITAQPPPPVIKWLAGNIKVPVEVLQFVRDLETGDSNGRLLRPDVTPASDHLFRKWFVRDFLYKLRAPVFPFWMHHLDGSSSFGLACRHSGSLVLWCTELATNKHGSGVPGMPSWAESDPLYGIAHGPRPPDSAQAGKFSWVLARISWLGDRERRMVDVEKRALYLLSEARRLIETAKLKIRSVWSRSDTTSSGAAFGEKMANIIARIAQVDTHLQKYEKDQPVWERIRRRAKRPLVTVEELEMREHYVVQVRRIHKLASKLEAETTSQTVGECRWYHECHIYGVPQWEEHQTRLGRTHETVGGLERWDIILRVVASFLALRKMRDEWDESWQAWKDGRRPDFEVTSLGLHGTPVVETPPDDRVETVLAEPHDSNILKSVEEWATAYPVEFWV
ncbi:hypothetical protein SUNI508_03576 [Seiridium unicorne]|uniref:RING-type domain-containing protein n=1 Tax=Seiridium unicorne TaxID=138068 RepID=A0ABR2VAZ9_9PEZI